MMMLFRASANCCFELIPVLKKNTAKKQGCNNDREKIREKHREMSNFHSDCKQSLLRFPVM